jgi:hypothetical protein
MELKNCKRFILGAGVALLCLISFNVVEAEAANPKIVVDGKSVDFGKTPPRNIDGFLSAPIRPLANALGVEMTWDAQAKMAIVKNPAGDRYIVFLMDSRTAVVNGSFVRLDTMPRMLNGTAVAPVKTILQTMDSEYSFDGRAGILTVKSNPAATSQLAQQPAPVTVAPAPVVLEETPAAVEETSELEPAATTPAAVTAETEAIAPSPEAAVTKDVTVGETNHTIAGIWQTADKSGFVLSQADYVVAGKASWVNPEAVGAVRGRMDGTKLDLLQWVDGKETTITFRFDADSGKLIVLENNKEVRRYDRAQSWNNTPLKSAMTFNGQWMDIWGNLIVIEVPVNASSNQIINGAFYDGPNAVVAKQIGRLRGSVKDGVYSGELIKFENGAEVKSNFSFSLMENGMFFKGAYSSPGQTDKKFSWDATRISF